MRRSRLTAAALLLVAVLAGCSDDPVPKRADPTDEPPTSSLTSPTSTSTTSTPSEPESPADFIRRWQDQIFVMQNSGDSTAFREMGYQCDECDDVADRVDDIYEGGGRVATQGGRVVGLTQVGESGAILIFEYVLHARKALVYDAQGSVVLEAARVMEPYQLNVRRVDGSWRVLRVNRV